MEILCANIIAKIKGGCCPKLAVDTGKNPISHY
jgi:hypothetical protein